MQRLLPQEWSLLRYGVRGSWLLSSEQTQVVQWEVHRLRESRKRITPAFAKLLALTLLPSRRHFQIQEANRELAAGRFVLYPDSQAVQTSLVPFIWKQKHLCTLQLVSGLYLPLLLSFREAVNDSLLIQRPGLHGTTGLACCLTLALWIQISVWKHSTACFHGFYTMPQSHIIII